MIIHNQYLETLIELATLNSIGGALLLGRTLHVSGGVGNQNLTSISSLNNLTSIGGNIIIDGNISLTNLTGLENITHIGGTIKIELNESLTSLEGLENIASGTIEDITINGNSSLSSCNVQSICDYLTSPNGSINIYNNAPGCDNPAEIASACGINLPCLPYGNYYLITQADVDSVQVKYPWWIERVGAGRS